MNDTKKVTEWVECKIGKILSDDIEKMVDCQSSLFNVEKYSQELFDEYFRCEIEENVREIDFNDLSSKVNLEVGDFYLPDAFSDDSYEYDQHEYHLSSFDNIIQELQDSSEITKIRALETLVVCSTEELVIQNSWTIIRKILQDIIKWSESEKLSFQILKLFRRFLISNDTPKVVCEGFVSLAESIKFHIGAINRRECKERVNEDYDLKTSRGIYNSCLDSVKGVLEISKPDLQIIFKSMWLLVQSQKGIPVKWSRFNEKRLKEIVFSFISMLSSTKNLKNSDKVCGLEILSVLDPKAVWVSNWCHGATGRSLLCSALRIHKKLFNEIVNFVVVKAKTKDLRMRDKINSTIPIKLPPLANNDRIIQKNSENPIKNRYKNLYPKRQKVSARLSVEENETSKVNRSAPPFKTDGNIYGNYDEKSTFNWIISSIPKEVMDEAKLCHCMSMVVYLIQYKGGRSLFPLEVSCIKRRITIADFVETVLSYIHRLLFFSAHNPLTKDDYGKHMLKLLQMLKSI